MRWLWPLRPLHKMPLSQTRLTNINLDERNEHKEWSLIQIAPGRHSSLENAEYPSCRHLIRNMRTLVWRKVCNCRLSSKSHHPLRCPAHYHCHLERNWSRTSSADNIDDELTTVNNKKGFVTKRYLSAHRMLNVHGTTSKRLSNAYRHIAAVAHKRAPQHAWKDRSEPPSQRLTDTPENHK